VFKRDGFNVLLPDVQYMRNIAAGMKVRLRGEIQRGDFEAAVVSLKTMYALARRMAEHPTLIGNLVGLAIAHIATQCLEEMIQQPNCPNMYWAVATLPAPFIGLHAAYSGERAFIAIEFGQLADGKEALSEAELKRLVGKYRDLVRQSIDLARGDPPVDGATWLAERSQSAAAMAKARERLAAYGFTDGQLARLPALQVALLDEYYRHEEVRDEAVKWASVPWWEVPAETMQKLRAPRPKWEPKPDDPEQSLLTRLSPAAVKVRESQQRLEQRLALIRAAEAVRMYAVGHGGNLPPRLEAAGLPVPVDPFTGQAFPYQLQGDRAVIRGSPPAGYEQVAAYNIRYEITVRK
jgi:hypothetical protein